MASERKPLDWFAYQVGMHSFRAFAQGKATWILNYSWDGDKGVDKRDAMKNLASSIVMAGSPRLCGDGAGCGAVTTSALRAGGDEAVFEMTGRSRNGFTSAVTADHSSRSKALSALGLLPSPPRSIPLLSRQACA